MKNPTYHDTIMKNTFWKEWVRDNELKPKFAVHESMECGWLSDRHFNAFLKFASNKLDSSWKVRHSKLLKKYNRLLANTCTYCHKNPKAEEWGDTLDTLVRDFTQAIPHSKSEVRSRINALLASQRQALVKEMMENQKLIEPFFENYIQPYVDKMKQVLVKEILKRGEVFDQKVFAIPYARQKFEEIIKQSLEKITGKE